MHTRVQRKNVFGSSGREDAAVAGTQREACEEGG